MSTILWLTICLRIQVLNLFALSIKPYHHIVWVGTVFWIKLEDEFPLFVIHFKVARVHWISKIILGSSHVEEDRGLSFPWGGFVNLFFYDLSGHNSLLFTLLASFLLWLIITQSIEIWELFLSCHHLTLWNKFSDSSRFES